MNNKMDLRILKTRKGLFDAMLLLLKKYTFEQIKVSDICEKALVNRSTFYSHFDDKYDLLSAYIKEQKNAFTKALQDNKSISDTKEYYMQLIKIFIDHIESKKEIYKSIAIVNKDSIVMDILYDTLNRDLEKNIEENEKGKGQYIPSAFVAKFYLGAVFGTCMELLENENKYTKEEIIGYLDQLLPNDLHFISGVKIL